MVHSYRLILNYVRSSYFSNLHNPADVEFPYFARTFNRQRETDALDIGLRSKRISDSDYKKENNQEPKDEQGSSVDAAAVHTETLTFDDIINITQEHAEPTNPDESKPDQSTSEPNTLLHFIKRKKGDPIWKKEILKISPNSEKKEDYGKFLEEIRPKFDRVVQTRPKKLLVLMNPIGGKRLAKPMYDTVMTPLFELANIQVELIVSERPKHLIDVISSYDYKSVDGIVMMGGDGTYSEIINVLIRRTQEEAGIDCNDETASLQPVPIPLAIMPTGTGNGVAESITGCQDVATATLHVIRGKCQKTKILSTHCDGKLVGYSGCIVGLGLAADMIYIGDSKLRWMKAARYLALPFVYLFRSIRQFDAEILVTTVKKISVGEGEDKREEVVTEEVLIEEEKGKRKPDIKHNKDLIMVGTKIPKTIRQQSCMLMAWPFDLLDDEGNFNINWPPFVDSLRNMFLVLYEPLGKLELLRHFLDLHKRKKNVFQKEYNKLRSAQSFRIKIHETPENSNVYNRMVSIDGEIQICPNPEYYVRILYGVLSVFSSYE